MSFLLRPIEAAKGTRPRRKTTPAHGYFSFGFLELSLMVFARKWYTVINEAQTCPIRSFTKAIPHLEQAARMHDLTLKRCKIAHCLAALAAFLCGVAIYALFRNIDDMILFRHLSRPAFLPAQPIPLGTETAWGYAFVFNLPHGLWCLSGLLVIRAVWLTNPKWRAVYAGAFVVSASFIEIMQISGNLPGCNADSDGFL